MSATQATCSATVIPSLTFPGVPIEVWIEVDGKKVPYYSREYDKEKKEVSCWIESEANKPFSIKYKPTTGEFEQHILIYLDGTNVGDYIVHLEHAHKTYSTSNVQVSLKEARKICFGRLELTDDDTYLKQKSLFEKFGEIRVEIRRFGSVAKRTDSTTATYRTFSMPDTTKIHERAKKGLTHLIKQGETKQQAARPSLYDTTPGPLSTIFVFRYRPRAMLQAYGVMPREPTSSSSDTQDESPSDKHDDESQQESNEEDNHAEEEEEEEKELLARLEEIRKKRKLAEESRSKGNRRKKVKVEIAAPKLNFAPGEVIDAGDDICVVVPTPKSKKPKVVIDLTL